MLQHFEAFPPGALAESSWLVFDAWQFRGQEMIACTFKSLPAFEGLGTAESRLLLGQVTAASSWP